MPDAEQASIECDNSCRTAHSVPIASEHQSHHVQAPNISVKFFGLLALTTIIGKTARVAYTGSERVQERKHESLLPGVTRERGPKAEQYC